jgi:hypothetical protein
MEKIQTTSKKVFPMVPADSLFECCRLVNRLAYTMSRSNDKVTGLQLPLLPKLPNHIFR